MPPGIGYGQMYQQYQMGPQMGMPYQAVPGGVPGTGAQYAAPMGMPGGMPSTPGFGAMYQATRRDPFADPNKRPGFGDFTGLDWATLGVGAGTDVLNWLEQRWARKENERQFDETMGQRRAEIEREEERKRNMAASWNRAVRGGR